MERLVYFFISRMSPLKTNSLWRWHWQVGTLGAQTRPLLKITSSGLFWPPKSPPLVLCMGLEPDRPWWWLSRIFKNNTWTHKLHWYWCPDDLPGYWMLRNQTVKGIFIGEEGWESSEPGILGEDKASAECRGQKNVTLVPAFSRAVPASPWPSQ